MVLIASTDPLHWSAALYIIALIVGGGLLAASTLGGGDTDTDFDADLDGADLDGGACPAGDGGAGTLATWISMRFVVFAMAGGGAVGTALTFMSDLSVPVIGASAAAAAIACGQFAHQVMRYLQRSSGNSAPELDDFVNQAAHVTVPVRGRQRGEVAVTIRGTERFLAAVARQPEDQFDVNSAVVIVGFTNGLALIVGRAEYEFVTDSLPGGLHE